MNAWSGRATTKMAMTDLILVVGIVHEPEHLLRLRWPAFFGNQAVPGHQCSITRQRAKKMRLRLTNESFGTCSLMLYWGMTDSQALPVAGWVRITKEDPWIEGQGLTMTRKDGQTSDPCEGKRAYQ